MQMESPQFTERPARMLEVRYTNGERETVVLERDDTVETIHHWLFVTLHPAPTHPHAETMRLNLEHVAMWRVYDTTLKTPITSTSTTSGTAVA